MATLTIHNWGTVEYAEALERMRALHAEVSGGEAGPALIVCNHPPVFTTGRRIDASQILAQGNEAETQSKPLSIFGIPLVHTERGGLYTYHDTGQIILYPILRVEGRPGEFRRLACALEEVALRLLGDFGVTAERRPGQPGVYCAQGKIASLGLAVKRQTTMHGLAINIRTNKENFSKIAACGVPGQPIANLADLAAGAPADPLELAPRLAAHFADVMGFAPADCPAHSRRPA